MSLQLITGPANSEKAGVVLDAYRAALDRAPILVVPTRADVDHYRRELAAGGAVLGVRVERFSGLIREAASRAEVGGRVVGGVARERLAAAAIGAAKLTTLQEVAGGRGFVRAALALFGELEESRIEPQRLTVALRAWAGDGPRKGYAEDVASVYSSYRRVLSSFGLTDLELHTRAVLDALRLDPVRWRATPVFIYGFDDFTPLQLDAIETLARLVDAPVTVSLSYEAGRVAFAGRATTYETLRPLADGITDLAPRDDHYAAGGRLALHHLERTLFDPGAGRVAAGAGVALLEGDDERAELELVCEQIGELLNGGYRPSEIGVVLRAPQEIASLIEDVFASAGLPVAIDRVVRFADTALGRGVLGLLRVALLDGSATDLLAYLGTPGVVEQTQLLDELERDVRRGGLSATAALAEWRWPLDAVERLRAAPSLLEAAIAELDRLFARPRRRGAEVLAWPDHDDALALGAARRALTDLRQLRGLEPAGAELVETLAELEVRIAAEPAQAVSVTDPLGLRARRVRALFVCRLQEGTFPRPPRPEPFFSDRDRGAIAAASGLPLARRPEALSAERYLFYATVSRPLERLVLSWHNQSDDGMPALRSLFVDDVCDLLELEPLVPRRGKARLPSAPDDGPEAFELRAPSVLQAIRGREAWSPSSLETCARCPVRWLLERQLRAQDVEPELTYFVRGRLVHEALRLTLVTLGERTGSARIDEQSLALAREVLRETLAELAPAYRISVNPERLAAALSEVELDLERYLEQAAVWSAAYEPEHFELEFGPVALGGLPVAGRIDRVDVEPGGRRAVLYDYKGREVEKPDDWLARRTLQLPMYMLAAREALDRDVVGGFYQPVGARPDGRRARGLLVDGADDGIACVRGDRREAGEVRALLDAALEIAVEAVGALADGRLEPMPETCTRDRRCAYPTICRVERA